MTAQVNRLLFAAFVIAAASINGPAAQATAVTVGDHYLEGSNRKSENPPGAATCANTANCFILFNLIPAGKQLLITRISCWLAAGGNAASNILGISLVTVSTTGELTDRQSILEPVLTKSVNATTAVYTAVGAPEHILKAGERPVVMFNANETGSFSPRCTIAGRVGNPPD